MDYPLIALVILLMFFLSIAVDSFISWLNLSGPLGFCFYVFIRLGVGSLIGAFARVIYDERR